MTSKIKQIIKFLTLSTILLIVPMLALAQSTAQGPVGRGLNDLFGIFPQGGIARTTTLTGPQGLIVTVIKMLLFIAGALAVLFVIIGGYQYLTSAGNDEQAEKGKKTLINAIIGIVIVILSYVIINVVVNFVSGYGGWF